MPKRIDTSKYRRHWRKMDPTTRLTYYWLWEHCNEAGVWEIDPDLFHFELGFAFDLDALQALEGAVVPLRSGEHLLLPDVLAVNYGTLKDTCNPHKPVLRMLEEAGLKQVGADILYTDGSPLGGTGDPPDRPTHPDAAAPVANAAQDVPPTTRNAKKPRHADVAATPGPAPQPSPTAPQEQAAKRLVDYLREKNSGMLDGSTRQNMDSALVLMERMAELPGQHNPEALVRRLIDVAKADSFHGPNLTRMDYLLKYAARIINNRHKSSNGTPEARKDNVAKALAIILERAREAEPA